MSDGKHRTDREKKKKDVLLHTLRSSGSFTNSVGIEQVDAYSKAAGDVGAEEGSVLGEVLSSLEGLHPILIKKN